MVPQRLKELVRLRIATLNGCVLCKTVRMAPQVVEELEAASGVDHAGDGEAKFTEAEVAAIIFAEKMAISHHSITDEDVKHMLKFFDEKQFLELSMMIGQFSECYHQPNCADKADHGISIPVGYGRVLAMLQLENSSCPLPSKVKRAAAKAEDAN